MRGEDPAAIRIVDIKTPSRPEIAEAGVPFIRADITDEDAVIKAFGAEWPPKIAKLPLSVFHTAAYISPADRVMDFMSVYYNVNVLGTRNVLKAAREAGADCFVATSSGSVGMTAPQYFYPLWSRWPPNWFQLSINADHDSTKMHQEDMVGNYSITKVIAERDVRGADSVEKNFRTGAIRPGHAIYGHGVEDKSSLTWGYLTRGGSARYVRVCAFGVRYADLSRSWLGHVVCNFVNAVNVSIAHLQYEHRLVSPISAKNPDIGGRGYVVCDPDGPKTYGDLYLALSSLAHPHTPVKFSYMSPVLALLIAHAIEGYILFRHRYATWLPELKGDITAMQPATLNVCTAHLVYDDSKSKEELGFKAPLSTLEGVALQVLDWNTKQEMKDKRGEKEGDLKAPKIVVPLAAEAAA
jgi:hypothetical protein